MRTNWGNPLRRQGGTPHGQEGAKERGGSEEGGGGFGRQQQHRQQHRPVPHLDLGRAPYVLYGVNYIDPVSLWWPTTALATAPAIDSHRDLDRAPYVLYGLKYIDLVSLWWQATAPASLAHIVYNQNRATSGFHTPKAMTYHEPTVM